MFSENKLENTKITNFENLICEKICGQRPFLSLPITLSSVYVHALAGDGVRTLYVIIQFSEPFSDPISEHFSEPYYNVLETLLGILQKTYSLLCSLYCSLSCSPENMAPEGKPRWCWPDRVLEFFAFELSLKRDHYSVLREH